MMKLHCDICDAYMAYTNRISRGVLPDYNYYEFIADSGSHFRISIVDGDICYDCLRDLITNKPIVN